MESKTRFDPNAATVTIPEVAVAFGGVPEGVEYWARKLKLEVVEDWQGRRSLRLADARKVLVAQQAASEAHRDKWSAYEAWKAAEKQRKARERAEAFARERAEAQRIKDAKRQQWLLEEIQSRESAVAAAEQARGVSFEEWSQSHDGGTSVPSDGMRSSVITLTDVRS